MTRNFKIAIAAIVLALLSLTIYLEGSVIIRKDAPIQWWGCAFILFFLGVAGGIVCVAIRNGLKKK